MRPFFASFAGPDGSFDMTVPLPAKLPISETVRAITQGLVGVRVVRIFAGEDGAPTQVGGGAFAPTYQPRLTREEQPMAEWLSRFLDKQTVRATLHERQELLDTMRRALTACRELLREGWFAGGQSPLQLQPHALLFKCLPVCNAREVVRYAEFCRPRAADALVLDIVWAAVCERAGLPHIPTSVLVLPRATAPSQASAPTLTGT
jgi:hypothetical protein